MDEEADEHEQRRDENRDLGRRVGGDGDRQLHVAAPREVDRRVVLGDVADDRDHDQPHEERREPERSRDRLDRVDEELARDDRSRDRRSEQRQRAAEAPGLALRGVRVVRGGLLRLPREVRVVDVRPVRQEQEDGDADRDLLPDEVALHQGREHGRQRHRGHREDHHRRVPARDPRIEALRAVLDAARERRRAEDEQGVPDDRARQGGLDETQEPGTEREDGDDELGGVAEGRVQEAAERGADPVSGVLGADADPAREGQEGERGPGEDRPVRRAEQAAHDRGGQAEGENGEEAHIAGCEPVSARGLPCVDRQPALVA